jgi:hypothetical protein
MTLGNAARAGVRLIVWCKECQHQVEPDPAEQAVTAPRYRSHSGNCAVKISRGTVGLGWRADIRTEFLRTLSCGIMVYCLRPCCENAQAMAAHESPRTTKLYDRTGDEITLGEVERITI